AIVIVVAAAPASSQGGRLTRAPRRSTSLAMANVAGAAITIPAPPTQNACASTAPAMRTLGMPSARSMAYSRRLAAVAAYSVKLVTTATTKSRSTEQTPRNRQLLGAG